MSDPRPLRAALTVLAVLQFIMLLSLFAGVAPHPPAAITPFAMAPFLALAIGLCLAAMLLAELPGAARALTGLAVMCALVSFGPQKYVDPAFPQIWPAVLGAQVAAIFAIRAVLPVRQRGLSNVPT